MLDRPHAWAPLRRLALELAGVTSALLLLTAATPIGTLWLGRVSALPPPLVALGSGALWFGILIPAMSALQSLYQGALVHGHRTRGVTESVLLYLLVTALVLGAGLAWGLAPGLPTAVAAMMLGSLAQVGWLKLRAAALVRALASSPRPTVAQVPAAPAGESIRTR